MEDIERESVDWTRRRPGGSDRKRLLNVPLSEEERAAIERGALATDESLAGFVRVAALERAKSVEKEKQ